MKTQQTDLMETIQLIGEKTEYGSYWTTDFGGKYSGGKSRENTYTVNTFEFETNEQAENFGNAVKDQTRDATNYFKNEEEIIHTLIEENEVKIYYGKNPNE